MGLSAGQTSHNSLQKSALNINGKISTKLLWSCHPRPAPLANQPWPTRSDQRGQGMRPAHLLPTTACASHPKILNQPDLHMTMVPQPPPQHSPQVGVFASALRCWPLSPLRTPRTWWSERKRKGGLPEMEPRRPPTIHCGRALECNQRGPIQPCLDVAALDLRHVTNQPTQASGPTSCSSSSSAWSRKSPDQNGLRIVAGVFATFANSVSHTFAVDRMTSAPPKPVSHSVWAAVHA